MGRVIFISVLALCLTVSCARRVVHVQAQPKVIVVKKAPKHHKIVVVKGKRYYYWNGQHYRKTRNGYIVARI